MQKIALENIKLLYESRVAVFKLLNYYYYYWIISDAEYKTTHGKEIPNMLARAASAVKQMLQRLTIELAQVKAGNISENLIIEIYQII